MDLPGVGPVVAARILADVGDVAQFPDRNRSRPGTAPHAWTPPPASRSDIGCPRPETERWTTCPTTRPLPGSRSPPMAGPTAAARTGRGQDPDEGHALPQAPDPGRRLSTAPRRRAGQLV